MAEWGGRGGYVVQMQKARTRSPHPPNPETDVKSRKV